MERVDVHLLLDPELRLEAGTRVLELEIPWRGHAPK